MSEKLDQGPEQEQEASEVSKGIFQGLVEQLTSGGQKEVLEVGSYIRKSEHILPDRRLTLETVYQDESPVLWRATLKELGRKGEHDIYQLDTVYTLNDSKVTKYHTTPDLAVSNQYSADEALKMKDIEDELGQVTNRELAELNLTLTSLLDGSTAEEYKWGK